MTTRRDELRSCNQCTIAGEVVEQPTSPVKAIRAFCMDCMGGSKTADQGSIAACPSKGRCPLWPFRYGKNPFFESAPRVLTDEQRKVLSDRMKNMRKTNKSIDEEDDSE